MNLKINKKITLKWKDNLVPCTFVYTSSNSFRTYSLNSSLLTYVPFSMRSIRTVLIEKMMRMATNTL